MGEQLEEKETEAKHDCLREKRGGKEDKCSVWAGSVVNRSKERELE